MTHAHTYDLSHPPQPAANSVSLLAFFAVFATLTIAELLPLPPAKVLITALGFLIVGAVFRRPPRYHEPKGTSFHGRIESKLGPYALMVVEGELRACPFILRLDDGRIAIVRDSALFLQSESETERLDIGDRIEVFGNPTLTPYAPGGYRGITALRFEGTRESPVGIRA